MNPRLVDPFGLGFTQDDVGFAIPHLLEDLPLYIDPFLLWRSDRVEYQELHSHLLSFLETLRLLELGDQRHRARSLLLECAEAKELGLGYGRGTKSGTAVGPKLADAILDTFAAIPQLASTGLTHIEVLNLLVPLIAEDRISDLASSVLKGFFVDYTTAQAAELSIPTRPFHIPSVWDDSQQIWKPMRADLPFNPLDDSPLLFAPLDLLRHLPWINYDDYYRSSYSRIVLPPDYRGRKVPKPAVLNYNRQNYNAVQGYVHHKEQAAAACMPDPLFQPLRTETLVKKLYDLRKLPSGKEDGSDKKYEEPASDLLSSLLYPELEFAATQVRTISGTHIRDVILYNDGKTEFLNDLKTRHEARQIVFELKNVKALSGEHVNQLYRYLDEEIGRFGVLLTRNPTPKAVQQNGNQEACGAPSPEPSSCSTCPR